MLSNGPGRLEPGTLATLLRWVAENPSAWPLPFLAFLSLAAGPTPVGAGAAPGHADRGDPGAPSE